MVSEQVQERERERERERKGERQHERESVARVDGDVFEEEENLQVGL